MEWKLLKVEKREGLVTVVIDNPPINLITLDLYKELSQFVEKMSNEKEVSVFFLKAPTQIFSSPISTSAQFCSFPERERRGPTQSSTPST